jgi:hypothetical protein
MIPFDLINCDKWAAKVGILAGKWGFFFQKCGAGG